jgi:hypothetical protein
VHKLRLWIEGTYDLEAQLAALGLVRQMPALARLEVEVLGHKFIPVEWPPSIPPSLKALSIDASDGESLGQSLLRALPGMLGASGAALDRLEVQISSDLSAWGEGPAHVVETLRCCAHAQGLLSHDDLSHDVERSGSCTA